MFQPRVKCEFVRRYCSPAEGWQVFVDVDPSEVGRTGAQRVNDAARDRQFRMRCDGQAACNELRTLGATVGGSRGDWCRQYELAKLAGDRDIVAVHHASRRYVIVEVEGESSGQPEQKLYKAIGQIVIAATEPLMDGWERRLVLAVYGDQIARHLARASVLQHIGVSGLKMASNPTEDRWLFGPALPQATL